MQLYGCVTLSKLRKKTRLAACKTLANALGLVQPDGWARGEREMGGDTRPGMLHSEYNRSLGRWIF